MSVREELIKAIESMNEEDLEELLEYAKWLQTDKADEEELALEERRELEGARKALLTLLGPNPGKVEDPGELLQHLYTCWRHISGATQEGMTEDKLERMEDVTWDLWRIGVGGLEKNWPPYLNPRAG